MTIRAPDARGPGRGADDRAELIAAMRDRFLGSSMPRLIMLPIVGGAGLVAFIVSMLALRFGVESMALRYCLASSVGYLAFAGFIRTWIAIRRRETSRVVEAISDALGEAGTDIAEAVVQTGNRPPAPSSLRDGRGGDADGSGPWSNRPGPVEADIRVSNHGGLGSVSIGDVDDAWWLVAAAVLALGGFVAVFYVIYAAPILLAEVALDAALVSALYRRLRRQDAGHWLGAVWRRTWLPALALIAFVTFAGFAVQTALPEARSIGDVLRLFTA